MYILTIFIASSVLEVLDIPTIIMESSKNQRVDLNQSTFLQRGVCHGLCYTVWFLVVGLYQPYRSVSRLALILDQPIRQMRGAHQLLMGYPGIDFAVHPASHATQQHSPSNMALSCLQCHDGTTAPSYSSLLAVTIVSVLPFDLHPVCFAPWTMVSTLQIGETRHL